MIITTGIRTHTKVLYPGIPVLYPGIPVLYPGIPGYRYYCRIQLIQYWSKENLVRDSIS